MSNKKFIEVTKEAWVAKEAVVGFYTDELHYRGFFGKVVKTVWLLGVILQGDSVPLVHQYDTEEKRDVNLATLKKRFKV
jgi:hypothetical protein